VTAIMLANRLGRKAQQPQRSPSERVGKEYDEADRDEQERTQLRFPQPPKPKPQAECKQGKRHRQGEIDEAEHEWVAEGEWQGKGDSRRQAIVDLAGDPQHSRNCHRRNGHNHQLGCRLYADQLGEGHNEQVDTQIPDRHPAEREPLLEDGAIGDVGRDLIASHMPANIHQRRYLRVKQGHEGQQDHQRDERPTLPPWARRPLRRRGSRRLLGQEVRRVDQAWSRLPSRRKRRAFSLMKPSASRWS
jgi:hypothetical protein